MVTRDITVVVADILVTSHANSGPKTLRDAILGISGTATPMSIAIVTAGTIALTTELPAVTGNITIFASADGPVAIDGAGKVRIFVLDGNVTIRDITISNGRALGGAGSLDLSNGDGGGGGGGGGGFGGGVYVNSGMMVLDHVTFAGNTATGGKGGARPVEMDSFTGDGGGGGGCAGDAMGASAGGGLLGMLSGGDGGTSGGKGVDGRFGGGGGGGATSQVGLGGKGGVGGFGGGGGGAGTQGGQDGGAPGAFGGVASGANHAGGGGGGGAGLGGALFVRAGMITLTNCTFMNNSAAGGLGGSPFGDPATTGGKGQGKGGAIFINSGVAATGSNLVFSGNQASDAGTTSVDNNDVFGAIN